jgi:hypothetical protein
VHDAITIERSGRPAVAICTKPFVATGEAMANMCGASKYQFAVIPHPIGPIDHKNLAELAHLALPQVIQLLLGEDLPPHQTAGKP